MFLEELRILSGSPFDASMFDTFRIQDTYFAPNAMTLVTVGPSPRKMLKKIRAVTCFTGNHVAALGDINVVWRGAGLPPFKASHRLVFDFVHDKSLEVLSIVQILAAQHSGDSPGNVYPSFANTTSQKRKTTHIHSIAVITAQVTLHFLR